MTERPNHTRRRFVASVVALIAVGCSGPAGPQGLRAPASQPALAAPGQFQGYIMSAQAGTILVIDTSTNTIVKRVKHPDLVQPANGKFHPNGRRFYASGRGKVTVWDTTDLSNPAHLETITPSPGSTGEYRGVHVCKGSTTATDGDVYWDNIQDGKVYVYRAPDQRRHQDHHHGAHRHAGDDQHAGGRAHRVRLLEGWRTSLRRSPWEHHYRLAHQLQRLHDRGCPHVHVVKTLETAPGYATPAFVDFDWDLARVYFTTKWSPAVVVFDTKTERILRYIDLGGYGPAYGVYTTPDKRTLYVTLGPPAQGAVVVVDVKTLTITGNVADADLNQPRAVRFPHY